MSIKNALCCDGCYRPYIGRFVSAGQAREDAAGVGWSQYEGRDYCNRCTTERHTRQIRKQIDALKEKL